MILQSGSTEDVHAGNAGTGEIIPTLFTASSTDRQEGIKPRGRQPIAPALPELPAPPLMIPEGQVLRSYIPSLCPETKD